jgi:hypothetical protein
MKELLQKQNEEIKMLNMRLSLNDEVEQCSRRDSSLAKS